MAIKQTFRKALKADVTYSNEQMRELPEFDICGIVGMVQSDQEGILFCQFTKEAVFMILKESYNVETDKIEKVAMDFVGEFTNLIYSNIKSKLNEILDFHFQMAIPAVITGENLQIHGQEEYYPLSKKLVFLYKNIPICLHFKMREKPLLKKAQ
ncbi:MAG: chemotaxis protein CheX [Bacteriovoracaceae bacterium]